MYLLSSSCEDIPKLMNNCASHGRKNKSKITFFRIMVTHYNNRQTPNIKNLVSSFLWPSIRHPQHSKGDLSSLFCLLVFLQAFFFKSACARFILDFFAFGFNTPFHASFLWALGSSVLWGIWQQVEYYILEPKETKCLLFCSMIKSKETKFLII